MKRLIRMNHEDFREIFMPGYSNTYMDGAIEKMRSLHGFHSLIANIGDFDSYRKSVELGYDVEFTLDRP